MTEPEPVRKVVAERQKVEEPENSGAEDAENEKKSLPFLPPLLALVGLGLVLLFHYKFSDKVYAYLYGE